MEIARKVMFLQISKSMRFRKWEACQLLKCLVQNNLNFFKLEKAIKIDGLFILTTDTEKFICFLFILERTFRPYSPELA